MVVADAIEGRIAKCALRQEVRLPAEAEMIALHGSAESTVRGAMMIAQVAELRHQFMVEWPLRAIPGARIRSFSTGTSSSQSR